ncbi:CocE/NonD family hydrolase [Parasphingopyxis sp.]|uniref:CocE/NonD family hydrolase n=1 Tax=Parasphingopyxis sp. TaxID=1920299 RepID=UPI00261CAD36|nr:CocE/NonD family hydrolase [Parasphingopyxis sp.]
MADDVRIERSVLVPMRDGIRLSTDLYFPPESAGPFGTVLVRTPYDKRKWRKELPNKPGPLAFARKGFAVAVQDKRGKFESEDDYLFGGGDVLDTEDTVNWLIGQSWSSGKVAMFGCSYLGEIQIRHAPMRNPNVVAYCPHAAGGALGKAGGRYAYAATRNGGAMELAQMAGWMYTSGSKAYYHPRGELTSEKLRIGAGLFRLEPDPLPIDLNALCAHLPTKTLMEAAGGPPTDWVDVMTRPLDDPWWDQFGYLKGDEKIDTPCLHINSWYDYGVAETLDTFNLFLDNAVSDEARDNQFVVISPSDHCKFEMIGKQAVIGERAFDNAYFPFEALYDKWFDRWLNGQRDALDDLPPVQYYLMGREAWESADNWPPDGVTFVNWYLHSGGGANSRHGDGCLSRDPPGEEAPDSFVYDPADPVPSHGGPVACMMESKLEGAFDQRLIESRQDVLVYSTPPLEQGISVVGPIKARLYVSSSAPDTDVTVKLVDVYPDGRAFNVLEGILRLRYREGFEREVFLSSEEICLAEVDLQATANHFGPGHRIRIEVSSSNFPRFDRNMNTGGRNFDETHFEVAYNMVHHSDRYPSHILLPIMQ